ncbi:uncharacterized protein L3040_001743 [Drepanopeziza brunnea f. sp. 'multigermtubi']|uniref:uncharacterized protein n=1 Tax=Drepanopeziza brunnea f. sp. 'multigermtubi' TaxID=698441 RepID=UPI00239248FB|nr:hypothetical protein L3040_001743 [Drepanopeziza brunnea f. sp. 'multigermtubi']
MDGSQYGHQGNGMSNTNSPYPSNVSPHQLQQQQQQQQPQQQQQQQQSSSHHHTTLPPMQATQQATQQATMPAHLNQYPGSAPHTPRNGSTPGTPVSANNPMGNLINQIGGQRFAPMMPSTNYHQGDTRYGLPQAAIAMSQQQPIASASLLSRGNQPIRPMPQNGMQMQPGMHPYGQNNMLMQDMEPPTHVVGSQGRRGILPSAPGRPAVSANSSGKHALIPAKDADGKFPCPHCTKTYLHAKHLKRHLLRHTGDRPYMCILCRDTFSRSDILKRHFQKCSIRRGNPTGASHLSHSQAHLKKPNSGPHRSTNSMPDGNELMGVNGMNGGSMNGGSMNGGSMNGGSMNGGSMNGGSMNSNPFGISPDGSCPDATANLTDEQQEQMRQRGLGGLGGRHGNRMPGPSPGGSNRTSFDQQSYAGSVTSMAPGMNPSLAFSMQHTRQNGHSFTQGYDYASHGNSTSFPTQPPASQDWSQMFQPPPPTAYTINPYNPNVADAPVLIKQEFRSEPSINNNNSNDAIFTGIYGSVPSGPNQPSSCAAWNLQSDPLEELSNRLIFFCFPQNQIIGRSNNIRNYLTAANIKHLLERFTSFQGHFPIIHMPTFQIAEAFDGLLLAIICIGAVYSDRIPATQVREMMELAKLAIERNSQVFSIVSREQTGDSGFGGETIGSSKSELEQITAIYMMQILFTWNGTPVQREKARRDFPIIAEIARRAGLTKPMTISPRSILHQPNVPVENLDAASFDWNAWVEQEKRSRLMFAIFLLDSVMVIFFNTPPRFERDEIRLPLPADDAAWDAPSSSECAEALGLCGPAAARAKNPEGSRQPKQPDFAASMKALLYGDGLVTAGTNLYSKFILVHALHVQLWAAQRHLSQQESSQPVAFPVSGSSTPDWRRGDISSSGAHSTNTSGRATPTDSAGQSAQAIKSLNVAFDKWKKTWDDDIAIQYPPSSSNYRRFGFCRDAIHFYWLGKYLMQNVRGLDCGTAPDQRFSEMMQLLKSVKTWVQADTSKRGEELGSVNDIHKDYGVTDLTLDMAQLFKPINQHIDSPVPGVQTNMSNNSMG